MSLISESDFPSKDIVVESIPTMIRGKRIGNDKTGKRAPLAEAFAIIAEIMVDAEASPKAPNIIVMVKPARLFNFAAGANKKNSKQVAMLITRDSNMLNINFPK